MLSRRPAKEEEQIFERNIGARRISLVIEFEYSSFGKSAIYFNREVMPFEKEIKIAKKLTFFPRLRLRIKHSNPTFEPWLGLGVVNFRNKHISLLNPVPNDLRTCRSRSHHQ